MPKWYKAICLKEIYWLGETHRPGERISIIEEDMRILTDADVIGEVTLIRGNPEFAMAEAPENAKRPYHRRARG